jgi:chromosome partitioning protein
VVVLDCPPSLGALTINALGAADLVLAPVQCEFFSARGVVKLVELVRLVRERRNPDLLLRLVPTLYDKRNNICRAVLAELRKQFPGEVSDVVVGIDTRVRESQARGRPITLDAPRSRAAVAYTALADEVRATLQPAGARRAQAA